MPILPVLLFAISSNMDNFTIGMSYGIKKIHIPLSANCMIGGITFLGTVASMLAGSGLLRVIPAGLAGKLGGAVIFIIGAVTVYRFFRARHSPPGSPERRQYDKDHSGRIEPREALTLGLALSLNNMGVGIGAGAAGLNFLVSSLSSFIISLVAIAVSNAIGKSVVARVAGRYAELAAGLIIIGLGGFELVR